MCGDRGSWELSITPSQFCYELKTALKNNLKNKCAVPCKQQCCFLCISLREGTVLTQETRGRRMNLRAGKKTSQTGLGVILRGESEKWSLPHIDVVFTQRGFLEINHHFVSSLRARLWCSCIAQVYTRFIFPSLVV